MPKGKNKQQKLPEETKQARVPDSHITQGLSHRVSKMIIINMLRILMKQSRKYERTDE